MRLTVTSTSTDTVFPLDIPDDLELENLKAFCEAEAGQASSLKAADMLILHNGQPLGDDKKTMREYGVKDGDVIIMERKGQRRSAAAPAGAAGAGASTPALPDFGQIRVPGASTSASANQRRRPSSSSSSSSLEFDEANAQYVHGMLSAKPDQLGLLRHNNPTLAEAFDKGKDDFIKVLREQHELRANRERQRLRMLTADPFDMEAQRLIAQEIESKNIEQNMELAMEYNPESFGTVIMLYIDCVVNGHHIKAFVDSGAQTTIMSQSAAERCGIMRLVDKRWSGIAKGVGTQKILGRVHMVQIQIEDQFLSSSFSILQEQPMDMLLGLDMLKRHQCTIDLKRNVLVIGSTGTETRFLSESELPPCARLSGKSAEEAMAESAKEAEDRQLKETLERSKSESEAKRLKAEETSKASTSSAPSTSTSTSAAGASATATSAATVQPSDKFTEADVTALTKYGFPRDKCVEELRKQNGDMKLATAALFAKSLQF